MFIPLVQQLFDDIIMRNEFSATEHPHTMMGLQSSLCVCVLTSGYVKQCTHTLSYRSSGSYLQ
jgi:hypothetical protein